MGEGYATAMIDGVRERVQRAGGEEGEERYEGGRERLREAGRQ